MARYNTRLYRAISVIFRISNIERKDARGLHSPGDPASPDNEATRPLRAGAPARDGAAPSPGNFFVRLRAAWKSMRNPEASPEELGYVPHPVSYTHLTLPTTPYV